MRNQFIKLYGKEKAIVEMIYDKTDDVASTVLFEKHDYNDIKTELESLRQNCYINYKYDILGEVYDFKVLPRCKNYFEMEIDNNAALNSNSVVINNQGGSIGELNAAAGSGDITQTINVSNTSKEILEILEQMNNIVKTLDDDEIKGDLLDDLEQIKNEIGSSTRDESKIKRALRRIGTALEPIKHITTVTTLFVHLDKLIPLVNLLLSNTPV